MYLMTKKIKDRDGVTEAYYNGNIIFWAVSVK